MKLLLHDYSGHPFQLELAEELANRGMLVEHVFCASIPTTPQAVREIGECAGAVYSHPISLNKPIMKSAFLQRYLLEKSYGRRLALEIVTKRPDVVMLANTPIDALGPAVEAANTVKAACVIWVQDLLGEAALRILPKRIGWPGKLIGRIYRWREYVLLAKANHLVSITDDFDTVFTRYGIPRNRWTTIPNWAPSNKIIPRSKVNSWSCAHGLNNETVFMYSGTLGFKHNPQILLALAKEFKARKGAVLVVNSEGDAADWLREVVEREGLGKYLRINGYQPFDQIADVLASADVLIAILEPEAGTYSVPSKVLSNHCAGRPQLLAVPSENLAARIVQQCGSGLVCDPKDVDAFVQAGLRLLENARLREEMGAKARAYAEENFQIGKIADRFESVFKTALENLQFC